MDVDDLEEYAQIPPGSSSKGSLIYFCIPPASCSNIYCWLYQKKSKMAGAPPGTAKMIIKERGIGMVLGYICGVAWKYTYHKDLTRRTKSFYHMLDKGEILVVVSED
ncbi:unnamed protein product [Lactuca virosa]|uniref:Uncharacterized protein n=1 Tax=Lactuca virosa TaxID=75947 RepID=A0AAU9P1Z7_9ASTR|nr:unnamed protein product [Lactuca virosa]